MKKIFLIFVFLISYSFAFYDDTTCSKSFGDGWILDSVSLRTPHDDNHLSCSSGSADPDYCQDYLDTHDDDFIVNNDDYIITYNTYTEPIYHDTSDDRYKVWKETYSITCILDDNSTSPDDNSTDGSSSDDDSNDDSSSDDGSSSDVSCPVNSYLSTFTQKCECNSGYVPGNECHNSDCSDLECISDPCSVPNSSYDGSHCVCDIGYTPTQYDLTTGDVLECSLSDTSQESDPCSYADSENGFEYRGKNYDSSVCQDDINSYGCGNGSFIKHDGCSFGACYYNYDLDCPQGDDNSTDGSSSDDGDTSHNSTDDNDTSSSTVDDNSTTSLALDKLDKSINGVGDKITDAVKNNTHVLSDKLSILDSTISSGFDKLHNDLTRPTHIPSTNDLKIDSSKVSSITSKVSDLESKIKDSTNLMQDVIKEYTNFASNLKDSFNSLKDNLTSYQEMFDNKPTVSISAGGSCNLSVNVFGHTVDFGAGLDKSLSVFAPIFKFVLSLVTQLSLIFISIRFFRKD